MFFDIKKKKILEKMSVVNCKVKFIRPEYSNLEEWTFDESNVYIGRAGVVFIDKKRFPQKGSIFLIHTKSERTELGKMSSVCTKYT